MKNYKELVIWQKGLGLVTKVCLLVKQFPCEEKYRLVSQINRAAVSISANIAAGSSRNSDKDYVRFLQIALGSAFEVQTYLVITKEMSLAKTQNIQEIEMLLEEEIKMIHSFLKKLTAIS